MAAAANLFDRLKTRDRRALAQLLTAVESGTALPLPESTNRGPAAHVIGITGSAGAGKSTLIAALIDHLRALGRTVAVLACDPQSPVTGGALLGDRIRVRFDPADEGVFFRSLSTRGAPGGISAATQAACDCLQAFGFDDILIETVGVGQDQIAVREVVDTLLLLVTPGTGDEVQWEKAGLIEVADLIAVNKSDLPGADRVREELTAALSLSAQGAATPVLNVTASTGAGVPELWRAIAARAPAGAALQEKQDQ